MCSRYSEYHCRQDRSRDIFPPSRHLFQTTQRNQRWLSGTSSLFVIALPIRDSSSLPLPPSSCQFLLVFNFFCREKTACRSRLSIQMGSVYRARTDHPLFPQRTIPFPMNNAFFRQESICRISRNVPTYNSFLSLSCSFFHFFSLVATRNIRIWASENLISPSLSSSHLFTAILRRRAQIRRLKGGNKRRI